MKTLAIVAAVVAASAVAACTGGAQPVPSPNGAFGGTLQHQSALPRERAGESLVYVSDDVKNVIAVFERSGRLVATITAGLNYPQGLSVDSRHDLWVANRGASNVLEFARGDSAPIATLNDDGLQPEGVALCPDGSVYVANIMANSGGGGNVRVYAPGHTRPARSLTYQGGYFFFPTCDAHGNVFVTMVLGTTGTVVEFPHGRQTGATLLPISMGGNPAGVTVDPAGNLLVEMPGGQSGQVLEYTEGGIPTGLKLDTPGWNEIALNRRANVLLGSTGHGAAAIAFPSGAPRHGYHDGFVQPIGVAIDPERY